MVEPVPSDKVANLHLIIYMNTSSFFRSGIAVLGVFCALFAGCGGRTSSSTEPVASTDSVVFSGRSALVDSLWAIPDSMLYGRACGMGQSAMTFVTDAGDTLDLAFSDDEGREAQIIGDREDSARYVVTLTADKEGVKRMINISQLDRHMAGYALCNGHLALLNAEGELRLVEVETLTDDAFVAVDEDGVRYQD